MGGAQEAPSERRGLRITGRVQGVGFRWFTRTQARSLDLRGAVRNRSDGSVEVHVEGPVDALDTLERRLRQGPPSAGVASVERIQSSLPVPREDFVICR